MKKPKKSKLKLTPRDVLYALAIGGAVVLGSWLWVLLFLPAAWLICAYQWPMAPCWRCQGRKTNTGSSKKRFGKCRACGGSGSRQVIGSKTVHRAIRSVVKFRKEKEGK